jgi:hypothetical protein
VDDGAVYNGHLDVVQCIFRIGEVSMTADSNTALLLQAAISCVVKWLGG